jgi:hypothetical protein
MGKMGEYAAGLTVPAHQFGSATSLAAAISISGKQSSMHARILRYLAETGGATDEEIQNALDMKSSTERPRRIELVEGGKVRNSGTTKKTASKRSAVIWVLA